MGEKAGETSWGKMGGASRKTSSGSWQSQGVSNPCLRRERAGQHTYNINMLANFPEMKRPQRPSCDPKLLDISTKRGKAGGKARGSHKPLLLILIGARKGSKCFVLVA